MLANPHSDAVIANQDYYSAPASETIDVTFSCMFYCRANSQCWTDGEGADMNGFNRDNFVEYLSSAVNWQAKQVESVAAAQFTLDTRTGVTLDRILEKTSPTAPNLIGTSNVAVEGWNVLARATLHNIPTIIGNKFSPALKYLFTQSQLYGDKANLTHPCWVSTEAYFIDDHMEPYRGRGHKDQTLLIPLIAGIIFMLLVPGMVVAVMVFQEQARQEKRVLLIEEEEMSERLQREVAEKENQVATHTRIEEAEREHTKKVEAEALYQKTREVGSKECVWIPDSQMTDSPQ